LIITRQKLAATFNRVAIGIAMTVLAFAAALVLARSSKRR
jgi:hypothetical protein